MNIDDCWLDDTKLVDFSGRVPSTPIGEQLMAKWPERYPGLLSSNTYRGCAIVLSMLHANMHRGITLSAIERIIEGVDQAVKTSRTLPAGTDLRGAAILTITNAWESAQCGVTADQVAAAYESELIYVAKKFLTARQHEMAGEKLP